ncbi:Protein of unknown function [Amycolatopsis xylanica]|uniref:DUF3761 domain-containing protein n=1 Tax=Amycolatopsis xylanica TaxID=589385 RepID=A0A1H3DZW2_9PSEU|nr:DUF3761 domain-containing protein [Amycolatopsis xylanica]SDX71981.1 Protein of unknown function [Amycolatopsis xylanica]
MRHAFLKAATGVALGFAVLTGCGAVATPGTVLTTTTPPSTTYPLQALPTSTSAATPTSTAASTTAVQPFVPAVPTPKTTTTKKTVAAECGADYYRNVDGNCVHRPGSSPSGATAKCKDGTYSYSQNRRGTCSGHGGVATWL